MQARIYPIFNLPSDELFLHDDEDDEVYDVNFTVYF